MAATITPLLKTCVSISSVKSKHVYNRAYIGKNTNRVYNKEDSYKTLRYIIILCDCTVLSLV